MQKESVNIIIQNPKEKYLLQMRDDTEGICNPLKWNFFGGGLKGGSPLADAVREMKEELDIIADEEDLELLGDIVGTDGSIVHVVRYKKQVNWQDFHLFEGAGAGFFTKEEILKIDITGNTRLIISKHL